MRTADFDYSLPPELIAQSPAPQRDQSRLLVLHRASARWEHRIFRDLPDYLQAGDTLVLNDSRVIPARLRGVNRRTGGRLEILLLEECGPQEWQALLRPARRVRPATEIVVHDRAGQPSPVRLAVRGRDKAGFWHVRFTGVEDWKTLLHALGEPPLPPYIKRPAAGQCGPDYERYQTVYARANGSVAAPTAGLHFTPALLDEIRARHVRICFVTLHVGPGTFIPVKSQTVAAHHMHAERYEISQPVADAITLAKQTGHRVVAVGTTTVRVLESVAALHDGQLVADAGRTDLFIYPPYRFRIVDALLTNFHLPRSTLLMLVSAFASPGETRGRELILAAYREAICERYRFYSYGDAMLIL